MAFSYESRAEAIEAGALIGIAEALISRDHESGEWGWADASAESGANDGDEGEGEGNGEGESGAGEADAADRVAEAGDVVLQVGGPMLPALARIEAERLAKRLGLTIIILDATTKVEVSRVTKSAAKGAKSGGGASIIRDERGLTEKQGIILDLVSRREGATNSDLVAGGATDGKSVAWEYQMACITRATKGAWVKDIPNPRMELNAKGKFVSTLGFRMREVPAAERAAVLYQTEVEMVAKKQLKAVMAPKPVAPVAPESSDDEGYKMAAD